MIDGRIRDLAARPGDHVDDPAGQAGFEQDAHEIVGAQDGRAGGLPDDGVPHHGRRRRQVAADRREVERGDGQDETVERPVLELVPIPLRADLGLAGIDPAHVGDVEPQVIRELAGRVDLRLIDGLALAEHRGGVHGIAVGAGQQVGRFEEDGRPVLPRQALPGVLRARRGFDGPGDGLGRAHMIDAEVEAMVVGTGDPPRLSGEDRRAADDDRHLDGALGLPFQLLFQEPLVLGSRPVLADFLVDGSRRDEASGRHRTLLPVLRFFNDTPSPPDPQIGDTIPFSELRPGASGTGGSEESASRRSPILLS